MRTSAGGMEGGAEYRLVGFVTTGLARFEAALAPGRGGDDLGLLTFVVDLEVGFALVARAMHPQSMEMAAQTRAALPRRELMPEQ